MAKFNFTDARVEKLPPRASRYEDTDTKVADLIVRVSPQGNRTFYLYARFPDNPGVPTRRAIGDVRKMTVAQARDTARAWHALIDKGIDPKAEQKRQKRLEQAKCADTFGAVAEEYIRVQLKGKRRAHRAELEIRRLLLPVWGDRPITEITRREVVELVETITAKGKRRTAHIAFGHARAIFNWAIRRDLYGLEKSPCFLVRSTDHAGPKTRRDRVLEDRELRALWKACDKVGYPQGRLVQLLLLTGARRTEVGEAQWSEFDLDAQMWTIPRARFKSDAVHRIPLSPQAMEVLEALPRHDGFVFSTTGGNKAVGDYSGAKAAIDAEMPGVAPWQLHDCRRTVRTRLSGLAPRQVAEKVIGHAPRDPLERTYDHYEYKDEMRKALCDWAACLMSIVNPAPPDNKVLAFGKGRKWA